MGDSETVNLSVIATKRFTTIGDFLSSLELSHWENAFVTEEIDLKTLFFLTDKHLLQLGLTLRERIKLLRCLQLFKDAPLSDKFTVPLVHPPSSLNPQPAEHFFPPSPAKPPPLPAPARTTRVPSSIPDSDPTHALCFIVFDSKSPLCTRHARLLEEQFRLVLKVDRISLCDFDEEEHTAAHCVAEFSQFLRICAHEADNLLWFIVLGASEEVNAVIPPCVDLVFSLYPGRNAFFLLDLVGTNAIVQSLTLPGGKLGFSFLSSCNAGWNNPLYLSLLLVDALRGLVQRKPTPYLLRHFVEDAFEVLEFLERCSDTKIEVVYQAGEELDPVEGLMLLPTLAPEPVGAKLGIRGIVHDRPIQIIAYPEGEFSRQVRVRFLEEYSEPMETTLEELMLDEEEEEQPSEQVLSLEEFVLAEQEREEALEEEIPPPPSPLLEEEVDAEEEAYLEDNALMEEDAVLEEDAALEDVALEEEVYLEEDAGVEELDEPALEEEVYVEEAAQLEKDAVLEEEANLGEDAVLEEEAYLEEDAVLVEQQDVVEMAEEPMIEEELALEEEVFLEEELALEENDHLAEEVALLDEVQYEDTAFLEEPLEALQLEEEEVYAEEEPLVEEGEEIQWEEEVLIHEDNDLFVPSEEEMMLEPELVVEDADVF